MSSILSKRKTAYEILEDLRENGISDEAILDYIICNNLSEKVCHQLMTEARQEFFGDLEDEDDVYELMGDESDFSGSDEDEDQEDQENNFIDTQMIAMQMEQNVLIEQEIQAKLVEEAYKICKGSWMWSFMSIPARMKKVKIVYEEIKKIITE